MKKTILLIFLTIFNIVLLAQSSDDKDKLASINITTVDKNTNPRKGEIITLQSVKTKKEYSGVTDQNGKLTLWVPKGDTYKTKQKTINNTILFDDITIPESKGKLQANLRLELTEILQDTTLTFTKHFILENVYFNTGSAILKPESFTALNNLAEVLMLKSTMIIEISGHTDDVGDDDANLKLSQKRAESVKNYLVSKGISPLRIVPKGYGETQPIADNSTPEGKSKNRRTEVKILKE